MHALLAIVIALFLYVAPVQAQSVCPGDPDCPTPTPTNERSCISNDDATYPHGFCTPTSQANIYLYCKNGSWTQDTQKTVCVAGTNLCIGNGMRKSGLFPCCSGKQVASVCVTSSNTTSPSPSLGISASPQPTSLLPTLTPSPQPNGTQMCRLNGRKTSIGWTKPTDKAGVGYDLNVDLYSILGTHSYIDDGTDIKKEYDNTVHETNETTIDIIQRQQYRAEVVQRLPENERRSIFTSLFTCRPQLRTTVNNPCFSGSTKDAACTVDLWTQDMIDTNTGSSNNEVIAPSTDADQNQVLDIVDFERIRAATYD